MSFARDFNPYHEPGGSSSGGEFASGGSAERISTRVPTGKDAPEDIHKRNDLEVGLESSKASEAAFEANAEIIKGYDVPLEGATTPEAITSKFIDYLKSNILALYDAKEIAPWGERAKLWYDGAHKLAAKFGKDYGISQRAAAGIMASLSPQTPWDKNVDLGRRLMAAMANRANINFSPEMAAYAKNWIATQKPAAQKVYAQYAKEFAGKTLAQFDGNDEKQAVFLRWYDQAHNTDRSYKLVNPEGTFGPTAQKPVSPGNDSVAWYGFDSIANAVSIFKDGSLENISQHTGGNHKVRNFYNNIIAPNHGRDVTIDTHAIAAALLKPLGASARETNEGLGGAASSSAATGSKGLYGLYAEAYRQAAKEREVLPRQMQSVTWEAGRGLFSPVQKRNKDFPKKINAIWNDHKNGKISQAEAQRRVLAGGIKAPSWAIRRAADDVRGGPAADARGLHGTVWHRQAAAGLGRGRLDDDARALLGGVDPTGTSELRQRFRRAMDARWHRLRNLTSDAIAKSDILGIGGVSINSIQYAPLRGAGRVDAFQRWFAEGMRQAVTDGEGAWMAPYIAQAYEMGSRRARKLVGDPMRMGDDRSNMLAVLTISEMHGVAGTTAQQATRAVAYGLGARQRPEKIARMVADRIKSVGRARSRTVVDYMVVKAFNAAILDTLRAAGVTWVHTIPEHLRGARHTHDAGPPDEARNEKGEWTTGGGTPGENYSVRPDYADRSKTLFTMPVEVVRDDSLPPYGMEIDLLHGGHIRVRAESSLLNEGRLNPDFQDVAKREIPHRIDAALEPQYESFFRFTNNPQEPKLAAAGQLRNSYNYADNFAEKGVSVANGPHYAVTGYKYAYNVKGETVGFGSDGEPILDPKTIKVVSPLRPTEDIVKEDAQKAADIRAKLGWKAEHVKASQYVFKNSEEFSRYVEPHLTDAARKTPQKRHKKSGQFVPFKPKPSGYLIKKAKKEYRQHLALGEDVDVLTAGDDRVCDVCDDIAANGPYAIDTAEGLIPAHPNCRCSFAPASAVEAVGDAGPPDEPRDPHGKWTGSGAQTESHAFNEWFGGSKIVGEGGKPLVVYHGSGFDISEFETGTKGGGSTGNVTAVWGSFFTPSPGEASRYASDFHKSGQNVMPLFLSIKNPYEMTRVEWDKHAMVVFRKQRTQSEALDDERKFRAQLEKDGHDGIIIKGRGFNTEYVAFHPWQIKSAIGNKGTFDPKSPKITDAGPPDEPRNPHGEWTSGGGAGGKAVAGYSPGIAAKGVVPTEKKKQDWRETSPKTIDEHYAVASDNQATLVRIAEEAARVANQGTKFANPGVKAKESLVRKLATDKDRSPAEITDVVRAGFDVPSPEKADEVVSLLAKHAEVADQGWQTTAMGYFDRKAILRFHNGQMGEIQMWAPGMFDAKEKHGGHKLYEQSRVLPPDDPKLPELRNKQIELYGAVRAKLDPSVWGPIL